MSKEVNNIIKEGCLINSEDKIKIPEVMEPVIYALCSEYKIATDRYNLAVKQKADKDQIEHALKERTNLLIGLRNILARYPDSIYIPEQYTTYEDGLEED